MDLDDPSDDQSGPHRQVSPTENEHGPHILDSPKDFFLDERPRRRHSVSSVESEYHPSSEDQNHEDEAGVKAEESEQGERDTTRQSSLKRSFPSPEERPFKRSRGAFNHEYLALLNTDIQDAGSHFVAHDGTDLAPSQIGLVHWTAVEKELFFEALSRLGPDDPTGIAARVRTKGGLEVAQYLQLVQNAKDARKQAQVLDRLTPTDVPGAVELSQACCSALEEAADALSVRQETYEESLEKKRWGSNHWLIRRSNCKEVEAAEMKSLELFKASQWLRLSECVFMNASFSEYNWMSVSDDEPAIRTTALEDFYSLAVSVTRRLVAATIYVSESRIRTKRALYPATKNHVWRQDVDAAVLSLGLPANARKFWAGCPRRLRLDVYDDTLGTSSEEQEPMSYDEVESALGLDRPEESAESSDSDLYSLSDTPSVDLEGDDMKEEEVAGVDEDDVKQEVKELLAFSKSGFPRTTRAVTALKARIRLARARDAYANTVDVRASYYEEKRLWALLGRTPPVEPVKPDVLEPPAGGRNHPLDDLLFTTTGLGGWRDNLGRVGSLWESEIQDVGKDGERETVVRAASVARTARLASVAPSVTETVEEGWEGHSE